MFVANQEYGTAGGAQSSFTNNKKVNQISKAFIRFSTKPLFYEYVIEDWDLKYIYLIYFVL